MDNNQDIHRSGSISGSITLSKELVEYRLDEHHRDIEKLHEEIKKVHETQQKILVSIAEFKASARTAGAIAGCVSGIITTIAAIAALFGLKGANNG